MDNAKTVPFEQSASLLSKERPMKGDALEHEDHEPEIAKVPKSNVGDSDLSYTLPKPASAPTSIWLTLGVLTAIVGFVTVSWKFLFGTKA